MKVFTYFLLVMLSSVDLIIIVFCWKYEKFLVFQVLNCSRITEFGVIDNYERGFEILLKCCTHTLCCTCVWKLSRYVLCMNRECSEALESKCFILGGMHRSFLVKMVFLDCASWLLRVSICVL